jgi:3-deoxy-D-manno-octulosonic-acid transferase
MGPHYENFRAIVEQLHRQDAIRIVQPDAMKNEFAALLADEASACAMGARAYTVFSSESGATARAVDGLVSVLGERV